MTLITTGKFAGLPLNNAAFALVDPPWSYLTYAGASVPQRAEEQHYDVMSLEDLMALPVGDLMTKDSGVGMWVIGSHLDQALALGRAWGFTYKTDLLVWVKVGKHDPKVRPISLGKWTRKQTEYMLLFTRGNPKRIDAGVRQLIEAEEHVIYAPKREHSRKPDEQYARLEKLVDGPFVELFARKSRPGWTTWGNQARKFDAVLPMFTDLIGGHEECRYCADTGWFYGDKDLGPCNCPLGDQHAPVVDLITQEDYRILGHPHAEFFDLI